MRWLIGLLVCLTCSAGAMSQQADWSVFTVSDTLASGSFPARTAARITWWKPSPDSVWFLAAVKPGRISWRMSLVLTDSADRPLWKNDLGDSSPYLLPTDRLTGWLETKIPVRLYLEMHPADPAIALRSQRSLLAVFTPKRDP